ncbi:MAG: diphthine synthase [Thermoplasmata archaeon]|nr:diphthine synthase [Thermoplasmata archaeon]
MGELCFIGLGLYDEEDMSLKALGKAKGCDVLYAEFFTSVHNSSSIEKLEKLLGKKVVVLGREDVEEKDTILKAVKNKRVGFLVPGDPMMATTHIDLRVRAEKEGIRTRLVHGQSIFTAASGVLGLQPYKFGRSTTIPFRKKGFEPTSPYEAIKFNKERGLHTLVLLDIDVESGRTLRVSEALDYLLEIERKERADVLTEETLVCVVADAGSSHPYVKADFIKSIRKETIEHKVQTLVVPGKLHFMEAEALVVLAQAPKEIRTDSG